MDSIVNWDEKVKKLEISDPEAYHILNRIYQHHSDTGTMEIPYSFRNRALSYLDAADSPYKEEALKKLREQRIVKIYNVWTGEGSIFNSLRAQRPGLKVKDGQNRREKLIKNSEENCDFCNPLLNTPLDLFGRVKGKYCVTAANLAKYDAWSSLLIFNKHNPLQFNREELSDYFQTAFNWFDRVYQTDNRYQFPFMVWNCLHKAGASQVHGHAQILMTREFPYAKIQILTKAMENYKKVVRRDYLADLYRLHQALGLAHSQGEVKYLVSITPLKEKEVIIISPQPPSDSKEAKEVIYKILRCYIDILGVENFNLALYCPPHMIDGFYLVKIVDRGPLFLDTVDMGGMELYGSSVAAADPCKIMETIKAYKKIGEN